MKYNYIITKIIPTFVLLALVCLFSQGLLSSENPNNLYKTGTKFSLTARWWGFSADGNMNVLSTAKFSGKDTILVRSKVTDIKGLLAVIVKFLRIYKESNTFDSYIDPNTHMPVRYEVYKLDKNGSKKSAERVYFDRKLNRIISLEDNSTIISNVAPDAQDTFSFFLNIIHRFNTERLFVGKKFDVNLYAYNKISKIEVKVTEQSMINGKEVYTLNIDELPDVFKYPASLIFEVADDGKGFKLPTRGKCTINVPILPDVTVEGELTESLIAG